jgi:phage-related protein
MFVRPPSDHSAKSFRGHRVFSVARFAEGVDVLHAFQKRMRKTAKADIELARGRFRDLLERRRKDDDAKG